MHISCVTPDRVWVSDQDILLLTDKSGDHFHKLYEIKRQILSGILRYNHKGQLTQTIPHIVEHERFTISSIHIPTNNGNNTKTPVPSWHLF